MAGVRPGPSTVAGLKWLAKVGPAPLGAWGIAMGWDRLRCIRMRGGCGRRAGWRRAHGRVARGRWCTRRGRGPVRRRGRGDGREAAGSRDVAALRGVRVDAAWLTARGREMVGPREMLVRADWRGELRWRERELRRAAIGRSRRAAPDGHVVPIEVELSEKSSARLKAVVELHSEWIAAGKSAAVIYAAATRRSPSACWPTARRPV